MVLGRLPQGYSEWDAERREDEGPKQGGKDDKRMAYEIDKARVIHSAAFRRLQGKTQVLGVGERDFYRTRLTHSLEVAQIGRGLCREIPCPPEFSPDADLVEAICLAHDIGHPPFGHKGEKRLHKRMLSFGGFGANAQNLRIVCFVESKRPSGGLNLTRATLDGLMKYPQLFGPGMKGTNFVYGDHKSLLEWVKGGRKRKPLEAQIADWADEITYTVHDIEDSFRAGLLDFVEMEKMAQKVSDDARADLRKNGLNDSLEVTSTDEVVRVARDLFGRFAREPTTHRQRKVSLKSWTSGKVSELMGQCRIELDPEYGQDSSNRYKYGLVVSEEARAKSAVLKNAAKILVFDDPRVLTLESKGVEILSKLFDAFVADTGLLPLDFQELISDDKASKERLVADFVAGMTDSYAFRYYERLFEPRAGSFYEDV